MNIIANGINLNDGVSYFVEGFTHEGTPPPDLNVQKIARTDCSILLRKNYTVKTIEMDLLVTDDSVIDLDTRIDTVKAAVEQIGINLDVDYAGGTRRYVCTGYVQPPSANDRQPRFTRLKVYFMVYGAFGQDITSTVVNYTGKTTSPYSDSITIGGTAPALPDITITINTLTGSGSKTVTLTNTLTGDYVTITRTWSAGDVISISSQNNLVAVNGVNVPYLGITPIWAPGANGWQYSDSFSARNVNVTFSYLAKYL